MCGWAGGVRVDGWGARGWIGDFSVIDFIVCSDFSLFLSKIQSGWPLLSFWFWRISDHFGRFVIKFQKGFSFLAVFDSASSIFSGFRLFSSIYPLFCWFRSIFDHLGPFSFWPIWFWPIFGHFWWNFNEVPFVLLILANFCSFWFIFRSNFIGPFLFWCFWFSFVEFWRFSTIFVDLFPFFPDYHLGLFSIILDHFRAPCAPPHIKSKLLVKLKTTCKMRHC